MTWFPDMGTSAMIDDGDHIRAVGWLSAEHPFNEPTFVAPFWPACRSSPNGGATASTRWGGACLGDHILANFVDTSLLP